MVTIRNLLYGIAQMYPPKSKWSVDDMPDLTGKVAMVTGGNSGIGRETVKALLMHNAKVYLATRDEQKARKAIAELKVETDGKEALFLKLDLADLGNARSAAEEFLAKEQELHIVFANAAIMACPLSILTEQKHDIQFGTNVLGHYHLVTLLLPALTRASELNPTAKSRVIFTSSSASYMSNGIEWDALSDNIALKEKGRKKVGPRGLYSMSKFGNIVLANELARRYGDKVVVMSCNPGNIKTELQRYFPSFERRILRVFVLYPASLGALTQLWGGTAAQCAEYNGKFLIPWARLGTPHTGATNPQTGDKLWKWMEDACEGF